MEARDLCLCQKLVLTFIKKKKKKPAPGSFLFSWKKGVRIDKWVAGRLESYTCLHRSYGQNTDCIEVTDSTQAIL